MIFRGKVLIEVFRTKGAKIDPKLGVASFMKNRYPKQTCLHKVTIALSFKTGLNYFWGKILLWSFRAKRDPDWFQNEVFEILWKVNARTDCLIFWLFSDFLDEFTGAEGEIMFWSFCTKSDPNGVWNEVFEKSMHGTFLIFCMTLQLSEVRAKLFDLKPS